MINSKSAIGWTIKQYQITTDKDSGVTNDPNFYSDNPRYVLDLMLKVIEVSVRSVDLIAKILKMKIIQK